MVLQIGIVGAGIAGLAAAIAQRKAGNEVEIFEQSTFKNEVGAAITMTPNGTRILDSWHFDQNKARAVESEICEYLDGRTLASSERNDFSSIRDDFDNHPFYHYHRVDLHTGLREMALDPKGEGPTPILHLGQKVVDVDCEVGTITLEGGDKKQKDLVIIADGIWSRFPSVVTQTDKSLSRSQRSAFRTLIPMDDINSDDDLKKIWEGRPLGFWVTRTEMTHVVTYPCRNNELLNVAVLHDTLPGAEEKTDWHSTATVEEVLSVVQEFNSLVIKMLCKAKEFAVHKIMRRDLVETLVRGRTVLIGDAAHWMFPTHAQGAVCAIEEGAAIALMTTGVSSGDVPKRLAQYNELNLDRIHVVQLLSNFGPRELAERKSKRPLFPANAGLYSAPVRQYFYSYDAVKETKEFLQQQQLQNGS